jgi:hypothetical protein
MSGRIEGRKLGQEEKRCSSGSSLAKTDNALKRGCQHSSAHADLWHETHHLEGPNSADPNLECAVNAFDILEINAFPPASASGLAPEQQQLLCHADSI